MSARWDIAGQRFGRLLVLSFSHARRTVLRLRRCDCGKDAQSLWVEPVGNLRGCGRCGRFAVSRLITKYGDASMPSLLPDVTACPKRKAAGVYDRCKATYERQDG
jgi:hypothetical protein